jgi:murein DD-endopeptidase MepM/ murein hydrolase activator NlpD
MSAVLVKTGETVTQGQVIGLMGATGRASGPHLHFEIRYQGAPQNPVDLLP